MLKYKDFLSDFVNAKENLENLVLRSPLLSFVQKERLLAQLQGKPDQEVARVTAIFSEAERNFFVALKKSGLDMEKYEEKIKKYFKSKIEKLEMEDKSGELENVENLLDAL